MHFQGTLPKAVLIFALLTITLFIGAQPAYASISCSPWFFFECILNLIPGAPGIPDPFSAALTGLAGGIVKSLSFLLIALIGTIGSIFFSIAGELVKVALNLNSNIVGLNPVRLGYNVILGIANMGFIVALVVIAFATMFRQENFGYKKALPRVIIAALLINFGFFIVTNWLIAPVDKVTASLNDAAHFDVASFKKVFEIEGALTNSFGDLSFTDPRKNISEMGKAIATTLFVAVFLFVGAIALFALAIMLAIRAIALVLLIILLPIAWVMWIFPNLKIPGGGNPWSTWWESFTRWLLFAPFAMFFFYLAVRFPSSGSAQVLNSNNSFLDASFQMIVVVGLMLGGLMASNKMGITGAAVALGAVTAGKVWAQSKAKQLGGKTGYWAYKRAGGEKAAKKLQTVGEGRGRIGRFATAPIRGIGRQTTRTTGGFQAARTAEFRKKIENLAPYQIADMYAGLNEAERVEALKYMIEKGYDWELVPQAREDIIRWARKDPKTDESFFDRNMFGSKLAELNLIDKGISPGAMAAQADYKEELAKARARTAPPDELQRIEYEGKRRVREAVRRDLNYLTTGGLAKVERRFFSPYDTTGDKAPYRMFSGDQEAFEEYRDTVAEYITQERPYALTGVRGGLRGDGAVYYVGVVAKELKGFQENYLKVLATKRGMSVDVYAKILMKDQLNELKDPTNWGDIRAQREADINAEVGTLTFLTPVERSRLVAEELAKVDRLGSEGAATNYQQLLNATRGYTYTVFGG